eukprot:c17430_g1_i3.p1 GENE.c17430_g1_i3~~c17430_g1_i3.p1  ORF type:complete len:689 (+),score=107.41 c17430_g1_i3:1168-3234(+)
MGDLTNLFVWDMSHNHLGGTIPSELGKQTNMRSWLAANNTLKGSLPSQLALLTELLHLDAPTNKLTGSLPRLPPKLEHVILHHNRLSGEIPSDIALLTKLRVLSLFNNRLTGSLPPLNLPSQLLLLFNNLLSCSLPDQLNNSAFEENEEEEDDFEMMHTDDGQAPRKTLLALGNMFQLDGLGGRIKASKWLSTWDSDSTHLFESYPPLWMRLVVLLSCCVLLVGVLRWLRNSPPSPLRKDTEMAVVTPSLVASDSPRLDPHSPLPLWTRCLNVCWAMTAVAAAHMAVLSLSRHVHTCVDPVRRVTLAETQVSLSATAFIGVAVCVVVHLVSSVLAVVWLGWRVTEPNFTSPWCWSARWRTLVMFAVWGLIVSVLHGPVLIYLLSESFPSNNVFGMSPVVVTILRLLVSPWLVLSGEWLIPKLSVWVATQQYSCRFNRFRRSSSDLTTGLIPESSEWPSESSVRTSTKLILVSQLVNLVVAPVLSQLILHNRCLGVITAAFWQPCQERTTLFDIDIVVETLVTAPVEVRVLHQHEVCKSRFDAELCQREVVASIATLSVSKVVIQTLVVLLRALVLIVLSNRVAAVTRNKTRRQRVEAWLVRLSTPSEEALTRSIVSLLMLGVALGGVAPLIWPMVMLCVYSTILMWRCSGQHVVNHSPRLVSRGVVWLGLTAQIGLVVWFVLANAEAQ